MSENVSSSSGATTQCGETTRLRYALQSTWVLNRCCLIMEPNVFISSCRTVRLHYSSNHSKNFTSDYSDRDAQGLTRAKRALSVRIYGIHHGNFSLAASNREPALFLNIWNMIGREDQRHAPSCWRHTGAATPPSSEDVVVVHAASTSLSVILHRRPTLRAAHAWRWPRTVWWQHWRCLKSKAKTMSLLIVTVTTRACHLMSQWRPTWQREPWLAYWSTRWCTPWTLSR